MNSLRIRYSNILIEYPNSLFGKSRLLCRKYKENNKKENHQGCVILQPILECSELFFKISHKGSILNSLMLLFPDHITS